VALNLAAERVRQPVLAFYVDYGRPM